MNNERITHSLPHEITQVLNSEIRIELETLLVKHQLLPVISSTHRIFRYIKGNEGYVIKLFNNFESKSSEIQWLNYLTQISFENIPKIILDYKTVIVYRYVNYPEISSPEGKWRHKKKPIEIAKNIFVELDKFLKVKQLDSYSYFKQSSDISMNILTKYVSHFLSKNQLTYIKSILDDKKLIEHGKSISVCHGSLFACNILYSEYNDNFCIIDWEKAHWGEKNRDYAGFFFSAWVGDGIKLPEEIENFFILFHDQLYFEPQLFKYWLIYYALRWSCNNMFRSKAIFFLKNFKQNFE